MTDPAWTLHWLEAEGTLQPWRKAIEEEIAAAREGVAGLVAPPRLDILVQCLPGRVIPETGTGGRAFRSTLLSLEFDPGNANLPASLASQAVRRMVVHEVHHCLRMAALGYGETLGEALVSEGLAGHFVRAVCGSAPELWECALDDAALRANHPSAAELASKDYGHDAWFYGEGGRYPRWLGYTLGYRTVGTWLSQARVDGCRWIKVPASEVLAAAGLVVADDAV